MWESTIWTFLPNGEIIQDINNLEPAFMVTVSDSQNCFSIDEFIIEEPDILSATASMSDVDCFGENTGSGVHLFREGQSLIMRFGVVEQIRIIYLLEHIQWITDVNGRVFVLPDLIVEEPNQELQLSL